MFAVQATSGNNFYTDNLKEAEEVYFKMCQQNKFVELLEGEPGHFQVIRQSQ